METQELKMDRKKMILEIIEIDGFQGNCMNGVHQSLELAYLSDLELTRLWIKKSMGLNI
jgi:hypothetical protein|tara:strand:- start:981 stop:1157 length:177 start_codon:yes stop_codon:yes gene_type:complete